MSVNFKSFLQELDQLDLSADEYAITASGPMAVREIRDSKDLDIIVSDHLWKELVQKYEITPGIICDNIHIGNIDILGNFKVIDDTYPIEDQMRTADIIDGKKYIKLEIIKYFKQKMARPKDLVDVDLIDKYLSQKPA